MKVETKELVTLNEMDLKAIISDYCNLNSIVNGKKMTGFRTTNYPDLEIVAEFE
jgi:hypothetical protein